MVVWKFFNLKIGNYMAENRFQSELGEFPFDEKQV